jgi:hypothetical protein
MNGGDNAHLSKTFMVIHHAISNELDLRDVRDCLEIGVKDGFLGIACLVVTVAVAIRLWVESLSQGKDK